MSENISKILMKQQSELTEEEFLLQVKKYKLNYYDFLNSSK